MTLLLTPSLPPPPPADLISSSLIICGITTFVQVTGFKLVRRRRRRRRPAGPDPSFFLSADLCIGAGPAPPGRALPLCGRKRARCAQASKHAACGGACACPAPARPERPTCTALRPPVRPPTCLPARPPTAPPTRPTRPHTCSPSTGSWAPACCPSWVCHSPPYPLPSASSPHRWCVRARVHVQGRKEGRKLEGVRPWAWVEGGPAAPSPCPRPAGVRAPGSRMCCACWCSVCRRR